MFYTRRLPTCLALACLLSLLPQVRGLRAETPVVVHVVDAKTRAPLPARVYLRSSKGQWFFVSSLDAQGTAVAYRKSRTPQSVEMHTTVSAHPFRAELPAGRYQLTIERGKEYLPVSQELLVTSQPQSITVALRRWVNMADLGWYSGDTHVHRKLEDLPNLVLAEDLNVALPLTQWVTQSHKSPAAGNKSSGAPQSKLIEVDETHVIYPLNTEYEIFSVKGKRHTLGAVFVLNHKQALPMGAPPVRPIAAAARQQGALLDLDKHSWPWSMMLIPVMNVDLFELANNHVWRTEFMFHDWTIDTKPDYTPIETDERGFTEWGWLQFGFANYYALLNSGFHLRPTAGTASGVHPVPLGFGRVYVNLPAGFSYEKWMAGLNRGTSFVTTGPMLLAKFNGMPPGSRLQSTTGKLIEIAGEVRSQQPLHRLEIVVNGEITASLQPDSRAAEGGGFAARFSTSTKFDDSGWVAVRCFEPSGKRVRFAHTAPVHVEVANRPLRPRKVELNYLIKRMQEELARNQDVLADDELQEYRDALAIYQQLMQHAR